MEELHEVVEEDDDMKELLDFHTETFDTDETNS